MMTITDTLFQAFRDIVFILDILFSIQYLK